MLDGGTELSHLMSSYASIPCYQDVDENLSGTYSGDTLHTSHLLSIFQMGGLDVCAKDVTLIKHSGRGKYFPKLWPPQVRCQSATALMAKGQVHVVVDVDRLSAKAFLDAVAGTFLCASGSILYGGKPMETASLRKVVGVVSRTNTAVTTLSVEENLRFAVSIATRESSAMQTEMLRAMATFVGLDLAQKAGKLSPTDHFRLRIAMELILDPPVLIVFDPMNGLNYSGAGECAQLLWRIAHVLHKTVLLSAHSLPTHLFQRTDTTLLFGMGGLVLYSGKSGLMPSYFNSQRIPRYVGGEPAPPRGGSVSAAGRASSPMRQDPPHDSFYVARSSPRASASLFDASASSAVCLSLSTPQRISQCVLESTGEAYFSTPNVALTSTGSDDTSRFVLVRTGDDAVDLAVEWTESEAQTLFYAARYYDSTMRAELLREMDESCNECNHGPPLLVAGRASQREWLKPVILLGYQARQVLSEQELLAGIMGVSLGLFTVSLLMHYQPEDQGGMYNIRGILFMFFVLALVTNFISSENYHTQIKLFLHQRNSGRYHTFCFLLVMAIRILVTRGLYITLFIPVVQLVVGLSSRLALLIGLVSVTHVFVMFTTAAVLPSASLTQWVSHGYFGYSIICSGFLLNLRSMPSILGHASVVRWGYGPALKEMLEGRDFSCDGTGNTSYCYTGSDYLKLEGFERDSVWVSVLALVTACGVLLLILGAALTLR